MTHPHFEAVKVAIKQDKTGYILTLNIHPDEVPDAIMRDYVGARYQVVMVRLNGDEKPMVREQELPRPKDIVQQAGILCADKKFQEWLVEIGHTFESSEEEAIEWLRQELQIQSRTELKSNPDAAQQFKYILQEFKAWMTA